jgi:hypothetical protein
MRIDPETFDLDPPDRPLFGVEALVAHGKRAARDEEHARCRSDM